MREHPNARQLGDQMTCATCVKCWDMNDPDPPDCLSPQELRDAQFAGIAFNLGALAYTMRQGRCSLDLAADRLHDLSAALHKALGEQA